MTTLPADRPRSQTDGPPSSPEHVGAHRARIPPVPAEEPRPLWSVMIPTHNCADYLRTTLASVLAQGYGPEEMQIEVVDDCSDRDDPEAVVRELGGDRVGFFRQPRNVGHVRNFETCLLRSRGRIVHVLHGDDAVREGFYRTMERGFEQDPEIGAAFCRTISMDQDGHWRYIFPPEQPGSGVLDGWLERIASKQRIQTPSIVVRREAYERLGGFDRRLAWTEDWEMWVRIAAHYRTWYEPEPLALYRVHSASSTGRLMSSGANIRDMRRAIEINRTYLPPARAGALSGLAREDCARYALNNADALLSEGRARAASAQLREALRCSRSPRVVARVASLLARWAGRSLRTVLFPRA